MAQFIVDGIGDVCASFAAIATIPDDVKSDMLNREADIIAKAQKEAAPRDTGKMADSIAKKAPRLNYNGGTIEVTFDGIHHTNKSGRSRYRNRRERSGGATRNAEVAFIHEFGAPSRNIPGQQWILKTNEANADEAVDGAAEIHDQWLTKCGL